MYNPTRRAKRFKRPLSSTWSLYQPSDTSSTPVGDVPGGDNETRTRTSEDYGRHRQAARPDVLRGAMLVALILVTIVLYIALWELERSSFTPVPKPNLNQSGIAATSSSSGSPEASSTRYPSAVLQDGLVLASSEGRDSVWTAMPSSKSGPTTLNPWPPPITRVPEEHGIDDQDRTENAVDDRIHKNEDTQLRSLDTADCDGTCRFLLPARVGEQESKARAHFTQLIMLAQRLNRTIVLPNVGKSRMSVCSKWPFDAYYDTSAFMHRDDSPGFQLVIGLEWFTKWVEARPGPPSSYVVSMESIPQDRRNVLRTQTDSGAIPFIVQGAEVDPKMLSCLESKLSRLRPSLPDKGLSILFDSGSRKTESNASTHLVQLLSNSVDMNVDSNSNLNLMMEPGYDYTPQYANSSSLSFADIDVLVLDYDLRHPLFSASIPPNLNLHYAPVLYDLADRLSDNLGAFLGVHWRMENVPVQNLAWCAASLVSTLGVLLQDEDTGKNVRHVWLATDHPRPLRSFMDDVRFAVGDDGMSNGFGSNKDAQHPQKDYSPPVKSSTFRALSSVHDDAIGILTEAFRPGGELETWSLTDLAGQLGRYPYVEGRFDMNEGLLGDAGVFGILDKLVVVQARAFVSGSTDCSKSSSFSKQVIEARQESIKVEQGKGATRNVVEYFGEW